MKTKKLNLLLLLLFCIINPSISQVINSEVYKTHITKEILPRISSSSQKVIELNGTNEYINCGNSSSIQIEGNSFTIETWIYPNDFRSYVFENAIVDHHYIGYKGYGLQVGGNGQFDFDYGDGSSWHNITSPDSVLQLNRWQHIAGVYDGLTMKLYVNGELVAEKQDTATICANPVSDLYIGEGAVFSGRFFKGKLDETRIWKSARTQAQIQDNMGTEISTTDTNLILYYKYNNYTNNLETDISTYNNTGDLIQITDTNYIKGYSMVFPQNLELNIDTYSIVSSWEPSINGTSDSYYLEVATDKDFNNKLSNYDPYFDCGDTLTKTITGLSLGTKYYVRIRCEKDTLGDVGAQFVCDSILLEDNNPPEIQPLLDINAECSAFVTPPSAIDDYAGIVYATTNDSTEFYTQGTHIITWVFDDENGNIIEIPQRVIIEDTTAPEILCNDSINISINQLDYAIDIDQRYKITSNELDLLSYQDNCSIKYVTNDYNNEETLNGSAFPIGNTIVKWSIKDIAENTSSCISNINIDLTLSNPKYNSEDKLSIYPNPNNGNFVVHNLLNSKNSNYIIKIYNSNSQIIFSKEVNTVENNISISNIKKGIYILVVENNKYLKQKKLIVY